jgi:MoxR-like ATPase
VFDSIDSVLDVLARNRYIAARPLGAAILLAARLGKPLLLEGEAGVGKTEVAKVIAAALDAELIRLQGYEGIDISSAVYEWNYARQIMAIRMAETRGQSAVPDVFGADFLMKRPLLRALDSRDDQAPPVLLIDELDRADDEFEAFLLEVLSDFQITIPEIGTIRAPRQPFVVIRSNRTRELHDALKRRCLYHWIEYPSFVKECSILAAKLPEVDEALRRQVVIFVQELRALDLYKSPGIAESLDWARALTVMRESELDETVIADTIGVVLKNQEDILRLQGPEGRNLLERTRRAG